MDVVKLKAAAKKPTNCKAKLESGAKTARGKSGRKGTYSDAICFDIIVSYYHNNADYTPKFINDGPPGEMRK